MQGAATADIKKADDSVISYTAAMGKESSRQKERKRAGKMTFRIYRSRWLGYFQKKKKKKVVVGMLRMLDDLRLVHISLMHTPFWKNPTGSS